MLEFKTIDVPAPTKPNNSVMCFVYLFLFFNVVFNINLLKLDFQV